MVVNFFNKLIYKLYLFFRNYLLKHNCLVYKDDFDFEFWEGI